MAAWRQTVREGEGMPRGLGHRHYHVEADGRLDRRFYQNRRSAWEVVASRSKDAPDTRWRVVACSILECFLYRL